MVILKRVSDRIIRTYSKKDRLLPLQAIALQPVDYDLRSKFSSLDLRVLNFWNRI
ncbi:MAG: hypothetical protein WA947_03545 [Phormidesmis sp.]